MGLGLLTKYTIAFFAVGLLVGMLLTPNRRYFRSSWFWCGVGVALLMALPVIVWQTHHHFVALAWMKSIHARDVSRGVTDYFIPRQFWNTTNLATVPIWCAGLWFLFETPTGKPFRMLGWMYAITLILFAVARGREYYTAPAYPMLMAAGAVWGENWVDSKSPGRQRRIMRAVSISLTVSALIVFAITLPIASIHSAWWRVADAVANNQSFSMEIGWPELVATIAQCVIRCPWKITPRLECWQQTRARPEP